MLVAIHAAWLTARFIRVWLPKQPARRRLAADVGTLDQPGNIVMKVQASFLFLLLLCNAVMADTNPPIPPLCEWDRIPPPPANSTMREMVNHSDFKWAVSIVDNELIITKAQYGNDWTKLPSSLCPDKELRKNLGSQFSVIEVVDGYLIGVDNGEWGGLVKWTDLTGDLAGESSYIVIEDDHFTNPIGFCNVKNTVACITGFTHGWSSNGHIIILSRNKEHRWTISDKVDLGSAGLTFLKDTNHSLTILTSKGLVTYTNGALITLCPTAPLKIMYPNSLVKTKETYYAGCRHIILEFSLVDGKYKETWLVPPASFIGEWPTCRCPTCLNYVKAGR
jgi:hypothetical protein